MELDLSDFLTSYPDYTPDPSGLFTVYGNSDMYDILQRKKEFAELTIGSSEARSQEKGSLLLHQQYIRRFLSGYTPYHSILLWHDVGTGKTISSIAVAEGIKRDLPGFNKTLVICRGPTFIRNFKNELTKIAPDYLPVIPVDRDLTENELVRRTNKLINAYYELSTFQVFGKYIKEMMEKDKINHTQRVLDLYSNRVIIIDEVHNLRSKKAGGGDDTYTSIHEFLHLVKNTKIVLLSATPIKDSVYEFSDIMNLILPMDKQLPTRKRFTQHFFPNHQLTHQDELLSTKGYISYLRQTRSSLRIVQAGRMVEGVSIPIVALDMEEPQKALLSEAYGFDVGHRQEERMVIEEDDANEHDEDEEDENGEKVSGLYKLSRQASLFAYKDRAGTNKYGSSITLSDISSLITPGRGVADLDHTIKLTNLRKYSAKYHYIIKTILEHPTHNFFIFSKAVTGSGIIILTTLLKLFGFQAATGSPGSLDNETKIPGRRFAEIQGKTIEGNVERLIDRFNRPENKYGEFIQIVIGSAVIGEGRSLKSVRDIMIVSPHWNYTEIDQAIGRGIRYESHNYLPAAEQFVTIHRLAVNSPDSIDLLMYRMAQEKDKLIKQLEFFVRETAVDCLNNKARNTYPTELNGTRDCLYQPCPYQCLVEPPEGKYEPEQEIVDTYNLFYTEKEYNSIKQFLQTQFSSRLQFSYRIEEFMQYPAFSRYSTIVLMRCLSTIIHQHDPFINPLGWTSYLKERNNEYFLTYDMLEADPSSVFDTKLGQVYPIRSFSAYLTDYQYRNVMEILLRIKEELDQGRMEQAIIVFRNILQPIQLQLLSEITKRNPDLTNIVHPVERLIVSQLQSFIGSSGNVLENKEDQVNTFLQTLRAKRAAGYLYYGYGEDALSISLIDNIPDAKSKGKACTSYTPAQILEVFDNLNKDRPSEHSIRTGTKESLCKNVKPALLREGLFTTKEISKALKDKFKDNKEFLANKMVIESE